MSTNDNPRNLGRRYKLLPPNTTFNVAMNPFDDHPHVNDMVDHLAAFSLMPEEEYNKIREVKKITALFHPFCKDIDRYVTLVNAMQLFFILDDHTECMWGDVNRDPNKANLIWGQVKEVFDKLLYPNNFVSMAKWKPYIIALYIAMENMFQGYDRHQRQRLAQTYRNYADSNQRETLLIEQNNPVDSIEELLKLRIDSVGMKPCFAMIEFADDLHLTDEEFYDPLMQLYFDYGTTLVILANDIASFEKELKENDFDINRLFNSVAITLRKENISVEESMIKTSDLYKHNEIETKKIKKQLLEKVGIRDELKAFIERVDFSIGGNFACGYLVSRYNHVNEIND